MPPPTATKTSRKKKSYTTQSRAPRARVCYVCGREVLISGYEFHITQCAELFQKREALKPKNEQRKLPENPFKSTSPIVTSNIVLNTKFEGTDCLSDI